MGRVRYHTITLILLLLSVGALPQCSGGCDEEARRDNMPESTTARLPASYPKHVRATAMRLAERLPANTRLSFFLASPAALIAAIERAKQWGVFESDQVEGYFASLEQSYGIDPGHAGSYLDAGFDLSAPAALAAIGDNTVLMLPVGDRERFETTLDTFLNERYGRPRPRTHDHEGTPITHVFILGRDLLSRATVGDMELIVTGAYFNPEAKSSLDILKALLDVEVTTSLGQHPDFQAALDELGQRGALFAYTPDGQLAKDILEPFVKGDKALATSVERVFGPGMQGFALVLDAAASRIDATGFARLSPERLEATRDVTTPNPMDATRVRQLIDRPPLAMMRTTFEPQRAEAQLLQYASKRAAQRWATTKANVLTLEVGGLKIYDIPDQILFNLAGQVLVLMHDLDEDRLLVAKGLEDYLRALDMVLFLPLKDASKADALFQKLSLAKGLVMDNPQLKAQLAKLRLELVIDEDDGVVRLALMRRTTPFLQLLYYKGMLALVTGGADAAQVRSQLRGQATVWTPEPDSALASLLADGAVWGFSTQASTLERLLSSRFEAIQKQIARLLAPIERLTLQGHIGERGVRIDLGIEIRNTP